jgi:hypothetical protein
MVGPGLAGIGEHQDQAGPLGGDHLCDKLSHYLPEHPGDLCRLKLIMQLGRAQNTAADSFPDFF